MNTFKKILSVVGTGVLVGSLSVITACKDQTLDDFRDEKTAEQLAIMKAAEGTFRGDLTAKVDGTTVAPVTVRLTADTIPNAASGGYRMERMAVLNAMISFTDQDQQSIQLVDGSYNPDDKTIKVASNIVQLNGQQVRLELSATLSDNHLVGELEIAGFTDGAGKFDLIKDGPQGASQNLMSEQAFLEGDEPSTLVYQGTAQMQAVDGVKTKVVTGKAELIVQPYSLTSDQAILQRFLPSKAVEMTLSLPGSTPHLNFGPGYWNTRNGALVANGETSSGIELKCRTFGTDMICHYRSNNNAQTYSTMANGDTATLTLKLVKGTLPK